MSQLSSDNTTRASDRGAPSEDAGYRVEQRETESISTDQSDDQLRNAALGRESRSWIEAFRQLASVGTLIGASFFAPGTSEAVAVEAPQRGALTSTVDPLHAREFLVANAPQEPRQTLSPAERERYQNIKAWFDYVESLPPGQQDPQQGVWRLGGYISTLRREAIAGNDSSLRVLHALSMDNIYGEIVSPGRNLVRFNYAKFDELKASSLSDADFKNEVRWRGLEGLFTYYAAGLDRNNELTRDIRRYYKPVMDVMKANPDHTEIQKWGLRFLGLAFPRLSAEEQNQVAEMSLEKYFNEPDGPRKTLAMRTVQNQYAQAPQLPAFAGLSARLVDFMEKSSGTAEARYHIVTLAYVGGTQLDERFADVLQGKAVPETQRAVAWALGRVKSGKALDTLIALAEDETKDARARGLAVISIQEYRNTHRERVEKLIGEYATRDKDTSPIALPAKVMLERMNGKLESEPDYFINRFLKPEEKEEYKRVRATYVKNFNSLELSTVQKNLIDWTLIPYRDVMAEVTRSGGRLTLINSGLITDVPEHRNLIGIRNFDGRMWESIGGVSGGGHTIAPIYDLAQGNATTFSHEVMHHVHMQGLSETQKQKVLELYRRAVKEQKAMNYYAAFNEHEYLAEGNKVFDTLYLKHEVLSNQLFQDGYHVISGQIRSLLKERDPELYEFLKRLRQVQDGLSRIYFNNGLDFDPGQDRFTRRDERYA